MKFALFLVPCALLAQTRTITADLNAPGHPTSQVWRQAIAAGRANEGLRADWQEQLATLQQEIGFRYLRVHGIFHDDMGVYREDAHGRPVYNFQYVDRFYDHVLKAGLKPFIELAFMPADLASGKQTIFWWKGNVTPPKSQEKWGGLVRAFVEHLRERYGHDEVKTWYFEVWNEADIAPFWSAGLKEYLELYKTSAEAVKSVSKEYRVGGPGSAIAYQFEEELVKYCVANRVPIDFVSTHSYGVKEGYVDETGTKGTVLDSDPTAVRSRMIRSRELIRRSALPNLELHFTEWSSSYTPTDPVHDQYHQAPFILDKIKGAQTSLDSMAYWVFTDIFEENGPRATPFHGGFGLLNYQGIRKPAYHAFQFLARLGQTELPVEDPSAWVTKDGAGGVAALFWDFTPIAPPQGTNDQVFYARVQPTKAKGRVKLELKNLAAGRYAVEVRQTGYRVNDAFTAWQEMGAPAQLTRAQEAFLKETSAGAPSALEIVKHSGGAFAREFDLRENDVFLVLLRRL